MTIDVRALIRVTVLAFAGAAGNPGAQTATTPPATLSATPPVARVEIVTDDYFGRKVEDPYRWLENLQSAETQSWMRGQADFAAARLKALPLREAIYQQLGELSGAATVVNGIQERGSYYFYNRRLPGEQAFSLCVREIKSGQERVLINPEKIEADGKRYAIARWAASQYGRHVAYSIAAGGSEQAQTRVVETATGKDMGVRIPRTRFGALSWMPDGRSFFYTQLQEMKPGMAASEEFQKMRAYQHRLGAKEPDRAVFGYGLNELTRDGIDMFWRVETHPGWNFALATAGRGTMPEIEAYVAPLSSLGKSPVPWRRIVSFADQVSEVSVRGNELYLLSYKEAPRSRVLRTSLSAPDLARAVVVVPQGRGSLQTLRAQKDAIYVASLLAGNYEVHRIDPVSLKSAPLPLPYPGSAFLANTPADAAGTYFQISTWNRSPAHFHFDPKSGKVTPTRLIPPSPVDMSHIEFVNAEARSHDGTLVPMVIIYKKGLVRDGRNPTLMGGYGAYGIENISPFFDVNALPWLDRGGIYVWTGVRGGGEYGKEWHRAGFQATKPNTWKDFIACAEYLVAQKYTGYAHLGLTGASAGGILVGNAIVERPELFTAGVMRVGVTNAVRLELTANGVGNIPEFGTAKTEDGFKALLAMDSYLKLKDGTAYPAMLVQHGVNDRRVDVWLSSKFVARLQAATASAKPVLLSLDYDAGHGVGSTRNQENADLADAYAFLFSQLGGTR